MNTSHPRAAERAFDTAQFRQALAQFATGVTVITTRLADGSFRGLTASSFNSVSLSPPLVLWSLGNVANSLPIFSGNSHYVINVLGADQAHLAIGGGLTYEFNPHIAVRGSLSFGTLMSLEPAVAALSGFVFLGETLLWNQWLALMTIIIASIGCTVTTQHARQQKEAL